VAKVFGTVSENGTLNVSNANNSTFLAGDHFKLFDAAGYGGSFASYALPSLNGSQAWSTHRLNLDGTLWVVSTVPPVMTRTVTTPDSLVLSGTGGTPSWGYYVLTSTDLTLPMSQWTRSATNSFDGSGNFVFTNLFDRAAAQVFLRVQAEQ
jgi:hypothetical protein